VLIQRHRKAKTLWYGNWVLVKIATSKKSQTVKCLLDRQNSIYCVI